LGTEAAGIVVEFTAKLRLDTATVGIVEAEEAVGRVNEVDKET
jgi:hypothetical protein